MTIAHLWMGGWGILIGLFWVGFWALLIVGLVAMLRGRPTSPGAPGGGAALRILEERYARGEIPREEFLERRSVLRGESGGDTPPAGQVDLQ
jgi:putative membrane protein